jgi:hypothetical protein
VQVHSLKNADRKIAVYLAIWIATAAVSLIIISIETVMRSRRVHSGLAMEMIHSALEQFLPAIVAGFLLTVVLLRCAAALRTAESLDASGLVAGAIQHGCICLVPISSAPDVIRLPGSR